MNLRRTCSHLHVGMCKSEESGGDIFVQMVTRVASNISTLVSRESKFGNIGRILELEFCPKTPSGQECLRRCLFALFDVRFAHPVVQQVVKCFQDNSGDITFETDLLKGGPTYKVATICAAVRSMLRSSHRAGVFHREDFLAGGICCPLR